MATFRNVTTAAGCCKQCVLEGRCEAWVFNLGQSQCHLKTLDELDSTYIIITSDHGYNRGHHRLAFGKFVFYEHSRRIPAVFAGPGIRVGSRFGFLGTNVDVAPTILGLAGIAPVDGTDGRSMVPLLVSADTAAAQGGMLPPSVAGHLEPHLDPRVGPVVHPPP